MNAKMTAVLLAGVLLASTPFTAIALEERTIKDEPSVQTAPGRASGQSASGAQQLPAQQQATPQGIPPGGSREPAAPDQQWEPGGQDPYYQPDYKEPSRETSGGSSRGSTSWTPGANRPDTQQQYAPAGTSRSDAQQQPDTQRQYSSPEPSRPGAQQQYGSPGTSGSIFTMPEATRVQPNPRADTYSRKEVDTAVMGFFEGGARGLAELISRAFDRYGEPTGFIKGGEGAGAFIVGLRYGEGQLYLKNGKTARVYWQSPSVGFDLGGNISKVFCLVYGMTDPEEIFQRFPGVDGSAYVIGGFGMNYLASGNIVLAPIRFGVGLRLGANVGYMGFTRTQTINPF